MGKLTVNTIEDNGNNTIVTADGLGDVTVRANTIDAVTGTSSLTLGGTNATSITLGSGVSFTGQNYPAFGARGTSDQALSTATFTQLTFPTEEFDIGGCYASNTFTVPSGKAGKYFFSVQAEASNNNNTFQIYWVKSGTRNAQHRVGTKMSDATTDPGLCMTALFDLSDGDTVSVEGYLSTAGNLRYKWFQGFRIGA
jgi:hypothetical protein